METTTGKAEHKYFIESFGCQTCPGRQYQVRHGKVINKKEVSDGRVYLTLKPSNKPNMTVIVNNTFAYDALDEAEQKAKSLLEEDIKRSKKILETSINLLKFN